jgi:hypothetical protein
MMGVKKVEEIRKSGLTFKEAKNLVNISIRDVKDGFVATGYYLWIIREERLWEDDGYNSFQEFLHCQYQKDKSWASRCISLYEQFGKVINFGELPMLAEPYRDYSVSQLIEMVSMTEEQREQVTPDMRVREIRELKPKKEKKAALTPNGEALEEAAGEKLEEQLPGQMELNDYEKNGCDVATEGRLDEKEITDKCAYQEGGKLECNSSASREEEVEVEEKPLSAHGTPRKVYPEDSLITSAGCESEPGGFKGGYDCSGCARECGIRQKECYCIEAPMGKPFPCDRMDVIGILREAVGDKCQFVNPDLAYRRQGDGEPVPCCKDCDDLCDLRCNRVKETIPVPDPEPDSSGSGTGDPDRISKPAEMKTYDRNLLEKMIADAEYEMEIMGEYWIQSKSGYYTQKVMQIQAYKNLLAEHDAAEVARPGLVENPEQEKPKLPVLKNNDQRKEWLKNYKAWGLWYRDEHIDVNYYKFDFDNGSRLIVAEFPQRENDWSSDKYDRIYYHLVEKGKKKYRGKKVYDEKYQDSPTSETELVEYLKKIQQKKKGGG